MAVPIRTERELEVAFLALYDGYVLGLDRQEWDPDLRRNGREHWSITSILEKLDSPANPPRDLIRIVLGFMSVEMLLPSYVEEISLLVRNSLGRAMFVLHWAGEEGRHHLALRKWLEKVGALTPTQAIDFFVRCFKETWNPKAVNQNFGDPWYGAVYTMWQELYTYLGYSRLLLYAKRVGQPALARICQRLATEEHRHHEFYMGLCQLIQRYAPNELAQRVLDAFYEFRMPGDYADLPDYVRWSAVAVREGVMPDPRLAAKLAEEFSTQRVITVEQAAQEQLRLDCWSLFQRHIANVFVQLGIPTPPEVEENLRLLEQRTLNSKLALTV